MLIRLHDIFCLCLGRFTYYSIYIFLISFNLMFIFYLTYSKKDKSKDEGKPRSHCVALFLILEVIKNKCPTLAKETCWHTKHQP